MQTEEAELDENVARVNPDELEVSPPFSDLFPVSPDMLGTIAASMRKDGYDASKPINVWRQRNIVVDGHTRRLAAIEAGVEVLVYHHEFADEQAAIEYAIESQRNRRNLTESEIVRCVLALDKPKERGGDRHSEESRSKASCDAFEAKPVKSASYTAKLVGTNTAKVERARRVQREAPDLLQKILDGEMMVNGAHNELLSRKGKDPYARPATRKKPSRTSEVHPAFLSPAASPDAPVQILSQMEPIPVGVEAIPLRAQLANGDTFDLDVRIYRWLVPVMREVIAKLRDFTGPYSGAWRGPLHQAIYNFSSPADPAEWVLCPKCEGKGVTNKTCTSCNASGYQIPKRTGV